MILIAFDPGFDVTGWATFSFGDVPRTLQGVLSGLVESGQFETDPRHPDAYRMANLGTMVHTRLLTQPADLVAIETPAYTGDYGGNAGRRASVNKLYMAIGAIMGQTRGERVVTVRALTAAKEERHELLTRAAEMIGLDLPTGPRGGKREDEWDAIWLGCQLVMDRGAILFTGALEAGWPGREEYRG